MVEHTIQEAECNQASDRSGTSFAQARSTTGATASRTVSTLIKALRLAHLTRSEIGKHSLLLADRVAVDTVQGIDVVAQAVCRASSQSCEAWEDYESRLQRAGLPIPSNLAGLARFGSLTRIKQKVEQFEKQPWV